MDGKKDDASFLQQTYNLLKTQELLMNVSLWNALMKSDFVFDRESYLTLRRSCYHFLQRNVPRLLHLEEKEVADFLSYAGAEVGRCYEAGLHFDNVGYLCQLESLCENTPEQRKAVYLHALYETFEQKMVMLFVAAMGIYAAQCDEEDDFWEPYGLSGCFLPMEKGFLQVMVERCFAPLGDMSLRHFDRRMAISIGSLYSLAVTLIGADEFGFHLHNFFHYIRQEEKQELMVWVNNSSQTH